MAARSPLRTLLPRRASALLPRRCHRHTPQAPGALARSFFSAPEPQVLSASATLPYHHTQVYERIADIDAYPEFLPYCRRGTRVTAWSAADAETGRRWPTRADLTAGWGGLEETYSSRVFCVPRRGVVEAISGDARTDIPGADLRRYGLRDPGPAATPQDTLFRSLVTRWTVSPAAADGASRQGDRRGPQQQDWSDVRLDIKFLFANPLYAAVSSAVADKLAPVMVNAFVEQAKRVLEQQSRKP